MVVSIFELLVSFHVLVFSLINLFLLVNLKFCRQSLIEIQSFSRRFLYHFENTVFYLHRTTVKSRFKILAGQKSKCCESMGGTLTQRSIYLFRKIEALWQITVLSSELFNIQYFQVYGLRPGICVSRPNQTSKIELFIRIVNVFSH